jgi:P27 family predicted phage terminase small subunit
MKKPAPKAAANGIPPCPTGIVGEARALWDQVTNDWVLDPAALTILDTACRALQQDHAAEALVAKEGLVTADRFGQQKAHPAVAVARDAKSTFLRAMKQLGLDVEPLQSVGRPPGRRPPGR